MILTPARAPATFIDVDKDVVNCGVTGRDVTMRTLLPIIVVFGQLVGIAILIIFKVRETPQQEKEMIEREDQAMSKVPDDPRVFARWAP